VPRATTGAEKEKVETVFEKVKKCVFSSYHPISWRDSISRPIAPVSLVVGGDDTTM
jgi:hypothetical protein